MILQYSVCIYVSPKPLTVELLPHFSNTCTEYQHEGYANCWCGWYIYAI